ncbi:hypothetical protein AMS68_006377 [Peltaster fructicola]|uniref:Mitochondrial intermediate peptidase n=1 Tax=Peltaster fructicola TaxID=286661 RepID=A0A6H0Y2J8_9PEZI|nr:hypothetical protein AMS68_006377 [Peltaster fructicola]
MFKPSTQAPWICTRCLKQQQKRLVRRGLITSSRSSATAATTSSQNTQPVLKNDPSTQHDDRTLRQIFDSHPFWEEYSSRTRHHGVRNIGLFQNRYLTRPEGFQEFAAITLSKCQRIVASVLACQSIEGYKRIARDLDRLSDLLCRVIDLSDFVRSVHPDKRFQLAAHSAYAQMFEYMNILNTTTGLDDQLKVAATTPEVWDTWNEEERTVATILMRDFAKSAIDMPQEKREAFVSISNEIAEVGTTFVDNMSAAQPYMSLPSSSLMGMDPIAVKQLTRWGTVTLPMGSSAAVAALRSVDNPDVRRDIYMAHRTSSSSNLHRLEKLLKRRAELARLSGFESYGHLTLSEKMAGSPEAVASFLDAVNRENTRVKQELQELLQLKMRQGPQDSGPIQAWDLDYYNTRLMRSLQAKTRTFDFLSAYFSLGTVMQGLSRMFHRLYGIRLVPRETLPGETWSSEVRRLDVVDDHEGHIAVIYCDLFEREGKSPNPAHFTLRCSREISQEEMEESVALSAASEAIFDTAQEAANDGLATAVNKDNGSLYQLPTIALICDFAINVNKKRPALLSFREVRTLFHEMGHALHSICGRTQLQNVSGTRCATDFAELPSVLNESFASAPEVLALWARHWETDEPLNVSRVQEQTELEKRMEGAEIESQILLGTLDQRYHSSLPLSWHEDGGHPSTAVYQDVWRQYSTVPEPEGTSWQGFFGHLFGYGATYYSYLFDRAVAGKIWRDVFQRTNALDPEAGHRYREEVLRWGGGRDGWKCVGGVLGGEEGEVISRGGNEAMKRVGAWSAVT